MYGNNYCDLGIISKDHQVTTVTQVAQVNALLVIVVTSKVRSCMYGNYCDLGIINKDTPHCDLGTISKCIAHSSSSYL